MTLLSPGSTYRLRRNMRSKKINKGQKRSASTEPNGRSKKEQPLKSAKQNNENRRRAEQKYKESDRLNDESDNDYNNGNWWDSHGYNRVPNEGDVDNTAIWWNGNGRGATNGSEEYHETVNIQEGYPVDYSCDENLTDETEMHRIQILYEYELAIYENADFQSNLRALEWSTLWNVAESIGLHKCDFSKQEKYFGNRRMLESRRTQNLFEQAELSHVVYLSSLGSDTVDAKSGSCKVLLNTSPGTLCALVQGVMTAQFTGSQTATKVSNFILDMIASEINSGRVITNDITAVRFVGDRYGNLNSLSLAENINNPPGTSPQSPSNSWIQEQKNIYVLAGIIVFAVIVVILFALLCVKKRSKKVTIIEEVPDVAPRKVCCLVDEDIKHKDSDTVIRDCNNDSELCGSEVEASQEEQGSDHDEVSPVSLPADRDFETNEVNLTTTPKSTVSPEPPTVAISPELSTATESEPKEPTTKMQSPEPQTVSKSPESTEPQESVEQPQPIVPTTGKPPIKPKVESLTLKPKRRRKRKKKKAQRGLVRVSSRNSMSEMDTIQEGEEENNDDQWSEYSTDDDDSACQIDTTLTPSTSADSDFTPSPPSFIDFDDSKPGGGFANTPKGSKSINPPSPIPEEPKIRRLPPPWI